MWNLYAYQSPRQMHLFSMIIIIQGLLYGCYLKNQIKLLKNECNAPCILVNKMLSSSGLLYAFAFPEKKNSPRLNDLLVICLVKMEWESSAFFQCSSLKKKISLFSSNPFDSSKSVIGTKIIFFVLCNKKKVERCKCVTLYAF